MADAIDLLCIRRRQIARVHHIGAIKRGFEPAPLHYEYCLYKRDAVPQNNPANAKFRLMIEAWRRMPIGMANWLGPYVVRNLG